MCCTVFLISLFILNIFILAHANKQKTIQQQQQKIVEALGIVENS